MTAQHFIVATAGHVDHGKSALVKALTGIDPDRLPEEKARGITIDLGFAHLELAPPADVVTSDTDLPRPDKSAGRARYHLGIVDVPGHEDFVKNMVAGVGSIDLALFVVAADDGWMPQTEEHLQILAYLGVTRAVIALSKIDLAEGNEAAAVARLRDQLRGSPFADAPIVGTSVVTGGGIEELKSTLARVLAETPPPRDLGKPRLPVDRVFTLRGIGTVVTGTLSGGVLHRGQAVLIQPAGKATRIRSLQSHNRDVEASGPGTRTALNLPDVAVVARSGAGTEGIQRGEVVTLAELGGGSDALDVVLEKSGRLLNSKSSAARPLKDGALVRMHHGSANFAARVCLFEPSPLLPGRRGLAQLRFDSPVFAFAGDRFIVRDWSEQATLAGGIVLDPDASRRNFRSLAQRKFLERRAESPDDLLASATSQLLRDRAVPGGALLLKSRFGAADVTAAISRLLAANEAIAAGDWVAEAAWWAALRKRAGDHIQAEHRAHPEKLGLPIGELRRLVEKELPAPEVFDSLLADLCRAGFTQVGTAIRHREHRPALAPHLQAPGNRLRSALAAKPFETPSRKELAPDAISQQALRFLLETGEAVALGDEVVLAAENFLRAIELIKKHIHEKGPATVSDLRQALGTSRRIVMPLLERLDRDGLTLRQGDLRSLKKPPAS